MLRVTWCVGISRSNLVAGYFFVLGNFPWHYCHDIYFAYVLQMNILVKFCK